MRYTYRHPQLFDAADVRDLLDQAKTNAAALPDWVTEAELHGRLSFNSDSITVTGAGEYARPGDMLVRNAAGHLFATSIDLFQATYQPVDGGS